jgi:hypothetical protein
MHCQCFFCGSWQKVRKLAGPAPLAFLTLWMLYLAFLKEKRYSDDKTEQESEEWQC